MTGKSVEVDSALFAALGQRAAHTDWESAVAELLGPSTAYQWTVDDPASAAPLLALPKTGARALVVNCGRGTHVFALAGTCSAVYAVDSDPNAVRFVRTRASQAGTRNVVPLIGIPSDMLAAASLDLVVVDGMPESADLGALTHTLRKGGRLCVGFPASRTGLGIRSRLSGRTLSGALDALRRIGMHVERLLVTPRDYRNTGILLDARDSRGLCRLIHDRIGGWPGCRLAAPVLLDVFRRFVGRGYWIIAARPSPSPSVAAVESAVRRSAGPLLDDGDVASLPLIYANRGTFTIPIYRNREPNPIGVFRMDAARSLVRHEARVLRHLALHADPPLAGSVPRVMAEGSFGPRATAWHSPLPGAPLPLPRTPRALGRHLERLAHWLAALYRVPVSARDIGDPHVDRPLGIYHDRELLKHEVREAGVADRVWSALAQLKEAGLCPSVVHGDLHPQNILADSKCFNVIDWEYATCSWVPLDWCYYVGTSLMGLRSNPDAMDTSRRLRCRLDPSLAWGRQVARSTQGFLTRLVIPPELYRGFLLVGFLDFVRRRHGLEDLDHFLPLFSSSALEEGPG